MLAPKWLLRDAWKAADPPLGWTCVFRIFPESWRNVYLFSKPNKSRKSILSAGEAACCREAAEILIIVSTFSRLCLQLTSRQPSTSRRTNSRRLLGRTSSSSLQRQTLRERRSSSSSTGVRKGLCSHPQASSSGGSPRGRRRIGPDVLSTSRC